MLPITCFLITIIFIGVAAVLLFPVNIVIPLDRRIGSLLGACVCIFIMWTIENNESVGNFIDIQVLLILTSIMVINFVIVNQHTVVRLLCWLREQIRNDLDHNTGEQASLFKSSYGFWLVSIISFVASPFIMNDGLCLLLVWPVLDAFTPHTASSHNQETHSSKSEVDYINKLCYMLTIACSANFGSVITFAGNPQNIIIAQSLSKLITGAAFLAYMLVPAVVGWVFTALYIDRYRRNMLLKVFDCSATAGRVEMSQVSQSDINTHLDDVGTSTASVHTDIEEASTATATHTGKPTESGAIGKYLIGNFPRVIFLEFLLLVVFELSGVIPLVATFGFIAALMLATAILTDYYTVYVKRWFRVVRYYFVQSKNTTEYSQTITNELHLSACVECSGGAGGGVSASEVSAVTIADDITTRDAETNLIAELRKQIVSYGEELFMGLDYGLLLIFTNLFIVSGCFVSTGIPQTIWSGLAGSKSKVFKTPGSVIAISIYTIVCSQLIGNVPLVYMAQGSIADIPDHKLQILGWLIMSWVSTIAGNVMLTGSAANIIVAEKAMRHPHAPVTLTFQNHFRVCGVLTLVCIVIGLFIIYIEALMSGLI